MTTDPMAGATPELTLTPDAHMDAKVLRRAAELVEQGHCKHALAVSSQTVFSARCSPLSDKAVAWCVSGAEQRARYEVTGAPGSREGFMEERLRESLNRVLGFPANSAFVIEWNNAPERTADEVAAALRAAADRCERGARG